MTIPNPKAQPKIMGIKNEAGQFRQNEMSHLGRGVGNMMTSLVWVRFYLGAIIILLSLILWRVW